MEEQMRKTKQRENQILTDNNRNIIYKQEAFF